METLPNLTGLRLVVFLQQRVLHFPKLLAGELLIEVDMMLQPGSKSSSCLMWLHSNDIAPELDQTLQREIQAAFHET
ncbi:hypothetical protein NL676_030280 [Syzygium grande]|nr:hypothetical protein NL676_030280 [Syzygium grande]